MRQTKLRTLEPLTPNQNITFPIGTVIAVKKYSQKLDFDQIFSRYKKWSIGLVDLLEALLTYRLTENQSTTRASEWINRPDVLEVFNLSSFFERTLFRVLEIGLLVYTNTPSAD